MPVSPKHRFRIVRSAATILFAVASFAARAQNLSSTQDLGLRGTEPVQDASEVSPLAGADTGAVANGDGENSADPTDSASPADAAGSSSSPSSASAPSDLSPESSTPDTINYGRPKPKKPVLYQLPVVPKPKPPIGYPLLPPLTTYKTAPGTTVRKGQESPMPAATDQPAPPPGPTVAVIPVLPYPPKPKREDKPYDPLGVDVGSLRLFPYVEVDTGYDSNPNRLASGVIGSSFVHGETGLKLQSQWSQNSLGVDLRAGYYEFQQVPAANQPDAAGTITGRVDVNKTTQINLESRFTLATQQPGSAQIAIPGNVVITNRPLVSSLGQTVGVSHQFNRLTLDLRGSFDRMIFGDATQSDGILLPLSQYDFNTYGLIGRASYELTPEISPFVQVTGDERSYDSYLDLYGFARDSTGIAGIAGVKLNLVQWLTGEVSAGYANRDYVDPRLPNVAAPTLDGSLIYNATPLTTLTLTAATALSETTLINASGAVSHSLTAQIAHALLPNLTLTGAATYQINQYVGVPITEQLYSARLSADYSLTRSIVIRGSFTHARLGSNLLGDSYNDNLFLVGLKLQR